MQRVPEGNPGGELELRFGLCATQVELMLLTIKDTLCSVSICGKWHKICHIKKLSAFLIWFNAFFRLTDVKLIEKLSSKLSNRSFVSHFSKIDT